MNNRAGAIGRLRCPMSLGLPRPTGVSDARAWFSNWGEWCDCCTRGEHVYSTFVDWDGPVEGEPITDVEHFRGWARWDGTSFAAPKVSAEIARQVAANPGLLSDRGVGPAPQRRGRFRNRLQPESATTVSPCHGSRCD